MDASGDDGGVRREGERRRERDQRNGVSSRGDVRRARAPTASRQKTSSIR